jgi:hypothetical protein
VLLHRNIFSRYINLPANKWLLLLGLILCTPISPAYGQISGSLSDHKNDVSTDVGDEPFEFSYFVDGRDYLDIISFSYDINPQVVSMKITFEFKGSPRLNGVYYSARFEGSTGQIEGPNFDIDALDSISDITIEYKTGELSDARFYDADSGEDEITFSNVTSEITSNLLSLEFSYPRDFMIESVFTQEHLDIIADVNEVDGEDIFYDIVYDNEPVSSQIYTYVLQYGLLGLSAIAVASLVTIIMVRRRRSRTRTTTGTNGTYNKAE